MANLRGYDSLSQAQKNRYDAFARKHQLTGREVYEIPELRRQARGHGSTPSTPNQALRHPLQYQSYIKRNISDLRTRVNSLPSSIDAYARGLIEVERDWDKETPVVLLYSNLFAYNTPTIDLESRGIYLSIADLENYSSSLPTALIKDSKSLPSSPTAPDPFWILYIPSNSDHP